MESSQLKRIFMVGLSILCLSPIEFFSNRLFDNNSIATLVLATDDIRYRENYLSNNYEIFSPNIKATSESLKDATSETLKTTVKENKKNESSDSEEDKLESKNDSENEKKEEKEVIEKKNAEVEVVKESVSTKKIATETKQETIAETVRVKNDAQPTDTDLAANLVNYALQFVGNPYRYGGTDLYNGVDCSGFTMKVYEHYGYSLPHSASRQSSHGKYVSLDNLQQGDLIFYGYSGSITHVGIYIGNGKIVHAATEKSGIKVANYTMMPIIMAKRIINNS